MALGVEVSLGPGHIVVDGDPASLPKKGTEPPIFGSLWSPYVIGQTIIFLPCDFYLSFYLLFLFLA